MNRKDQKKLSQIGINITSIQYSYPDEAFMKEIGMWNYEQCEQTIDFLVKGHFETPEIGRQVEDSLLLLVKAMQSDDPRVMEMLGELGTLLNLTDNGGNNT